MSGFFMFLPERTMEIVQFKAVGVAVLILMV